jgi:ABC-2 type transport system permease protein
MTSNGNGAFRTMLVADARCFLRGWVSCLVAMAVVSIYFGVAGAGGPAAAFALPMMGAFFVGYALYGCDEKEGWFTWRRTLGASARDIVRSHYLLILAGMLAGAVLAAGVFTLTAVVQTTRGADFLADGGANIHVACMLLVMGLVAAVVCSCVVFPVISRFGVSKGLRYLPVILVFLVVMGGFWVDAAMSNGLFGGLYALLNAMVDSDAWWLLDLACVAGALALYALSGRLSSWLFEKRRG